MKRILYFILMLVASIMTITFTACGGDDKDDGGSGGGNGSGSGGNTPTTNIIGTWRAYYQRNGVQLYDLVRFNADHTGYIIEEVGNGTDYENPITWTQTGNVIKVILDGDYVITWTIQQVIDENTVIISDGKRTYNVVRDDGTGGGTTTEFVSKGGGSLSVSQLWGTWQVYHVDGCASENGQTYTLSEDVYPGDQNGFCRLYEFYTDYTYKNFEYYNGSWSIPHGPYNYQVVNGSISLPDAGGTPRPEYCKVTANKTNSEEIVITMYYTQGDQYMEYLLKRVEGGGPTPATNPVLGTFNFVYQSYYDETPYDYTGGTVTIEEDPYNTDSNNAIRFKDFFLEGSDLYGYYDLGKNSVYIAAWQVIDIVGEYGLVTVNWKDTQSDWISFGINKDGTLTSDCFGVVAYNADFTKAEFWWTKASIATLTPIKSSSARKRSAKRSVTTKAMKIDKTHLPNKRIKK